MATLDRIDRPRDARPPDRPKHPSHPGARTIVAVFEDPPKPPIGAATRATLARAQRLLDDGAWAGRLIQDARREVVARHREWAAPQIRERLGAIGVDRLRDATAGRLRLAGLPEAGFATVLDVLDAAPSRLEAVPGIGPTTSTAVRGAALQLADAVAESVQVRLEHDPENRDTTPLVRAVHRLSLLLPLARPLRALTEQVVPALRADVPGALAATTWFRWLVAGGEGRRAASVAFRRADQAVAWASENRVDDRIAALRAVAEPPPEAAEAWAFFAADPASFYSLLAETVGVRLDVAAVAGYLPADIVARIEAQRLDDTFADVRLRGYQSFGARFALVQRRVILGDEMGLGKTVQALVGLAHLRAAGATHFLVVCPASVLVNWLRETRRHTRLDEYRLHGPDRAAALADWLERGGVGVTTFDTAATLDLPEGLRLDALVVDEAHFVKNPETRRARVVAELGARAGHVWFLTGTPMENRVAEFGSLVATLAPAVALDVDALDGLAGAARFRAAVAPVYLRRNAADVLSELPPLEQADEWCEFVGADGTAYAEAVQIGNFSAMRRAGFASTDPREAAKVERLLELVAEARRNGRKVVVFSYFLSVLATAAEALRASGVAPDALGPLTGATPAADRQRLVDDLTAADGPGVLVAQIQAGGVGLNLQAASVVVLCEPQVKPTLEAQAVARTHRLGQLHSVQVHRLLTEDSVDERLLEILQHKERLFDTFARDSALADTTPAAVDVSEVALARQVIAAEQARLQPAGPGTISSPGRRGVRLG